MDNSVPCLCHYGIKSLGILYGVSMGKGRVRLDTVPGCPRHDPKSHKFLPHIHQDWCAKDGDNCIPVKFKMCRQCNGTKKDHTF